MTAARASQSPRTKTFSTTKIGIQSAALSNSLGGTMSGRDPFRPPDGRARAELRTMETSDLPRRRDADKNQSLSRS
jgi:hypothetical protein